MFSGDIRRMATVVTADDQATGTLQRVQAQGDETSQSLDNVNRRAQGLRMGFMAAAGATAALGAALGALVMTQGRAEQTFARLAEVSGATADQMERVENKATDIGANLPVSIGQAAGAMEQLAFAGFSVEEQLGAANQAANLAVASNMKMQEAARQTASLLNMFSIEAGNAQQVTATLAATFSSSATNMQELSRGLSRVGQIATQTGLQLSEMSAAMGVLADQGIRAARAGQGLRSMLTRLVKPTSKAEEALSEANVELDKMRNAEGDFKSLNAIVTEFRTGLEGVENNATRARIITEAVGREGARALIPLINNQEKLNKKMGQIFRSEVQESLAALGQMEDTELESLNEATELDLSRSTTGNELAAQLKELEEQGASTAEIATQLEVALGISSEAAQSMAQDVSDSSVSADQLAESLGGAMTAADIAASQMDTTRGAITFLKSSIDTMTFAIFSGASPAIQWLNEQLAAGINVLNNNEAAMKAVGTALVALTGIFATLSIVIGGMYLSSVVSAAVANGFLQGTFIATALASSTLTGAMYALAAGIWAALTPVLPFVAAGLAIVGVFYLIYEAIQANLLGVGDDLSAIMAHLGSVMNFLMPILQQTGRLFWNLGKIFFMIAAAPIVLPILAFIKGLRMLLDAAAFAIDIIGGLMNGTLSLGEAFDKTKQALMGFIQESFQRLMNIGSIVMNFLTGIDWAGLGMSLIKGLVAGILVALFGIPGLIIYFFRDEIVGALMGLGGMLMDAGTWLIDAWVSGVLAGFGMVKDAFFAYIDFVKTFWFETVPNAISGVADAIISPIVDGVKAYLSFVKSAFYGYINFVRDFWLERVPNAVRGAGEAIIDTIVNPIRNGVQKVIGPMKNIADAIASFLPFSNAERGPLSNIMSSGGAIIDALVGGLKGGVSAVAGAAGAVAGAIGDAIGGAVDMAKGAGEAVVSTVSDGMKSAGDMVKGAAGDVAGKVRGALPFSDAEWGPLSDITSSGPALVQTLASGVKGEKGAMQDAMSNVMGVVEDTPLGQAVGGAADSLGIQMPGGQQSGSDSGGGGAGGVSIEIEQFITVEGDGDAQTLEQAAEQGTSQAVQDAIAELERLLQQDLNA